MKRNGEARRLRAVSGAGAALAAIVLLAACGSSGGSSTASSHPAAKAGAPCTKPDQSEVRLSLNPQNIAWLPYFVAIDRGYFKQEGLDLTVRQFAGSSATQLPLLSRGDLDLTPIANDAGLYSGYRQGFHYKLVIANNAAKDGYMSDTTVVARPNLLASGKLAQLSGLKGLRIDAQVQGSIADLLSHKLLEQAGLSTSDVTLTYRAKTPPDVLSLFKHGGVDVAPSLEPIATLMQLQGVAKKWKTTGDVFPGLQDNFLAASPGFLDKHRCTAVFFTRAYLKGVSDVLASNGKWTPKLIAVATKWTKLPPEVIKALGATPYSPPDGAIDPQSLTVAQDVFAKEGLVRDPIDVKDLIDTTVAAEATKGS